MRILTFYTNKVPYLLESSHQLPGANDHDAKLSLIEGEDVYTIEVTRGNTVHIVGCRTTVSIFEVGKTPMEWLLSTVCIVHTCL